MSSAITKVDHAILFVRDLDTAATRELRKVLRVPVLDREFNDKQTHHRRFGGNTSSLRRTHRILVVS